MVDPNHLQKLRQGVDTWNAWREREPLVTPDLSGATLTRENLNLANLRRAQKIRDVIDTVGKKGVLLLGRFTEGRIAVLERLRAELRERGYLPIVFNFDKPETKDFTETVRLLAGLSRFVIAAIIEGRIMPIVPSLIPSQLRCRGSCKFQYAISCNRTAT
jgi:hypothetical protein